MENSENFEGEGETKSENIEIEVYNCEKGRRLERLYFYLWSMTMSTWFAISRIQQ